MARVKGGFVVRRRHKKVLKLAKGYFGSKHRIFKTANEQVMKSLLYAYRDRRTKKTRLPQALDRSDQCGSSHERFVLQQIDAWLEIGRSEHQPQNAGGSRRQRPERI